MLTHGDPVVLTAYFNRQGYLHEWISTLHTAAAAREPETGRQPWPAITGYACLRLASHKSARPSPHSLH